MANIDRGPRKRLVYGVTGGLLAVGFLLMAFYDTGGAPVQPRPLAAITTPPS